MTANAQPLLIPMTARALVVNTKVHNAQVFYRWAVDYAQLGSFKDPVPPPFESEAAHAPDPGVYLHWVLPEALTHGEAAAAGSEEICFPLVPNRWLVMRSYRSGETLSSKSWIVESDYVDSSEGTSPFINPFPAQAGAIEPTKMGRVLALESWDGDGPGGSSLFLRAVGPGDLAFAAYQPGVENIFSFYDALGGVQPPVPLTYLVMGWYSDPQQDPLYGPVHSWGAGCQPTRQPFAGAAGWKELLAALRWSVEGSEELPTRTLYHALIYDVKWQDHEVPPRKNPNADHLEVVVGNTGVDALAAFVRSHTPGAQGKLEAETLEAFAHNALQTLKQPDGAAQLDLKIRRSGFGSAPGGTFWEIVPVESSNLEPGAAPPQITPAQAAWVAQLNTAQQKLDATRRELDSLRWELYATWWKAGYYQQMPFPEKFNLQNNYNIDVDSIYNDSIAPALKKSGNSSLIKQVTQLAAQVASMASGLPDPTNPQSIAHYAGGHLNPSELELKPRALPPFEHPSDPVVLVAGLTSSGAARQLAAGSSLPCRFADQAVTGVQTAGGPVKASSGDLQGQIPTPHSSHLPAAIAGGMEKLAVEAFFVDPGNATLIVKGGLGSSNQQWIQKLESAMADHQAQISSREDPLIAAFAFAPWQQAWAPLYLDWEIYFQPTVGKQVIETDNYPFDAGDWSFDGSEYDWQGTDPASSLTFLGRSVLTSKACSLLSSRLEDYLESHANPELKAVETLIASIGQQSFFSQTLSGLNDQLIMRSLETSHPPDASVAQEVGEQYDAVPAVALGNVQDTPFFFPVRGGFFSFHKLAVVDAFGQVLDLTLANGNAGGSAESFHPLRGRGLAPQQGTHLSAPQRLVKQAPRVVQGAGLRWHFVAADNDQHEVGYSADADPVCGWLLPNHLDGALLVYDATGNALGELMLLVNAAGTKEVSWQGAPDSPHAVADPSQIGNAHLAQAVGKLVGRGDEGAGFVNFLQAIDETLWRVDPLGGRSDQNLSVLIGRPLALVRARLDLELHGLPVYSQSWLDTLKKRTADFLSVEFAVRLGSLELFNDGLMGYFLGTSYERFNSVHQPAHPGHSAHPYLAPIGVDGNYVNLQLDSSSPAFVTLLLDPRGDVHVTTGILPTRAVQLPARYFEQALARMAVTFRTGPVLSEPSPVRLPRPAEHHGSWSWIERTGTAAGDWRSAEIVRANAKARLSGSPPAFLEGWLKLTPKDIEDP